MDGVMQVTPPKCIFGAGIPSNYFSLQNLDFLSEANLTKMLRDEVLLVDFLLF
jgi:hypothetical protein